MGCQASTFTGFRLFAWMECVTMRLWRQRVWDGCAEDDPRLGEFEMDPIDVQMNALDSKSLTVSLLEALDFVAPGSWTNVTGFHGMITHVTGVDRPGVIKAIGDRAIERWHDPAARYDEALLVLKSVDVVDRVAAAAATASKIGGLFGGLDFLKDLTPKPETTQALDAALKLTAELLSYGLMNGVPDGSFEQIADFVIGLQQYAKSDIMRISAWVIVDGLMPLGPNFMQIITRNVREVTSSALANNALFSQIAGRIPGEGAAGKQQFILDALEGASGWMGEFVAAHGLTREVVLQKMSTVIDVTEDKLDYVAAALDASTSYFAHTGTQTVARILIEDAYEDLRQQVWLDWVNQQ